MNEPNHTQPPGQDTSAAARVTPRRRVLSTRWAGGLAAAMLGIGVTVGAAIGPAPAPSLAGSVAARLPLLLAGLGTKHASTTASASPQPSASAAGPASPPAASASATSEPAGSSPSAPAAAEDTTPAAAEAPSRTTKSKGTLPAVTNVWLIQLAGEGFGAAAAQPSAAPYITSQLLPAATLLSSWTALQASAFAAEAALAEPPPAGSTPPILHSIVQPPCPEGAAGASCAPETLGQLATADAFLGATLATITGTPAYKEHGLVVVTFATVGIPTQSELPAGASTSQLTSEPPAGAALLSPFAKAGARSSVAYDPTSPRQSLEKLLR
jgi:predicted lipid-binding transport protein (Tim44 family)